MYSQCTFHVFLISQTQYIVKMSQVHFEWTNQESASWTGLVHCRWAQNVPIWYVMVTWPGAMQRTFRINHSSTISQLISVLGHCGHMTWYILNISDTFLSQDIVVTSVWYIYVKSDVGLHISLPLRSSEIMLPLWTTSVLTFECVSTSSSTLWCGKFILCFIWINSFVFSAHYFMIHALQRTRS